MRLRQRRAERASSRGAQKSNTMSQEQTGRRSLSTLIYDEKFRGTLYQIVVAVALIAFVWWIVGNTIDNLSEQDKKSGFGFLGQTAGFQILSSLGTNIVGYVAGVSTYWDVFVIGVINTLTVAVLGILAATALGFVMGVMRLSKNAVFNSFATVYVETLRNIPLLLQIFFWYFFVLRALPDKRDKLEIVGENFAINITGLYAPRPVPEDGFALTAYAFLAAILICIGVAKYAKGLQERTGKRLPVGWISLGTLVGLPLLVHWSTGSPLSWEMPEFKDSGPILRRGFQDAGLVLKPEMISLWLALTLYTASFIAEIVRAGILAVPHGQSEASGALGVKPGDTLRLVIIPQAMRVIIPPLTSQYLNLTKNSSLAVAIAYPDIVSVFAGTALNQVGQEIEMIFMMMVVYLLISLSTSLLMNWFNNRMKLVER